VLTIWAGNFLAKGFWRKDFGAKAAHKMLVKLAPSQLKLDVYERKRPIGPNYL
jgi:hypothetical protein